MTGPLRILRVADIADNRTGGMSRYIHFVSDHLRESGHAVEHLFAEGLRAGKPERGRLSRFAIPVRVVRAIRARLARGERYDVIEIHEPIAAGYALARRVSRHLPPLLVSVYALEARGHLARLRYERAAGRPANWRARLAPLSVVWQANLALKLADHTCVETSEDAAHLRIRLGVPASRVSIQHGGVEPRFFAPAPSDRGGVLFVGSWIERKGVIDLALALSALLDRRPDVPITIAGCGCPAERVLEAFPAHHRPFIRVLPQMADDDALAALYRTHRVFAFPSTFEGLPLVLLEAAAAGLAIVTTGVCGMKDVLRDGTSGLFVPVGDAARLTDALLRVLDDPELADRLGQAAQETAREYTWERSAEQFLVACRAAIRRGGRAR